MAMPRPTGKAKKIADAVLKNKGVAAPKKAKRDKEPPRQLPAPYWRKYMRGINDQEQDEKTFKKMLKAAMPGKKVTKHLKKDIKEQKHGIKDDKKLMFSIGKKGCK